MSKWRGVENELPEPGEDVLVWAPDRYVYIATYSPEDEVPGFYWHGDGWDGDRELEPDVTHWRPIPEPPETVE